MGYGMLWIGLLWLFLVLGFAYIIGVMAMKETGNVKLAGQVIAGVIAVLTIIIFLYGAIWGGQMKRGMMGGSGCPMMGKGMKMDGKMDGMKMGKDAKMMHKMMGGERK
jgi:hypothetical protein